MSDLEETSADCVHSLHSVDSAELMYFVKSVAVSCAGLC